jgi:hypothetical protein
MNCLGFQGDALPVAYGCRTPALAPHRSPVDICRPISVLVIWRHLVWHRNVEIDVTIPLEHGMPLELGGRAIAGAISKELFCEVLT